MVATDPLSLLFVGSAVFALAFFLLSNLLGLAHHVDLGGHLGPHAADPGGHLGAHDAHLGAHDAAHAGHAVHAGHDAGHDTTAPHPAANAWGALRALVAAGLSLYGLLMFLLIFGLSGYLLLNLARLVVPVVLVAALTLGAVSAAGLGSLLAWLFPPESRNVLTAESSQLEGRLGEVSIGIRADGLGEVLFTRPSGGRQSIGAASADGEPIAVGTEVVILGISDGIARVQPWDRFMAAVRTGQATRLGPLEA